MKDTGTKSEDQTIIASRKFRETSSVFKRIGSTMILPLSLVVFCGHAYELEPFSVVFIKCRVTWREWQRCNICVHCRYIKQGMEISQEIDCVGEQGDQFWQYAFV